MPPAPLGRLTPLHLRRLAACAVLTVTAASLHAQVSTPADPAAAAPSAGTTEAVQPGPRYVLAMALLNAPTYAGSATREHKMRPAFSFQVGRWTVSTSRAVDLGGLEVHQNGPGASTVLRETAQWQTGLSLRVNRGRSSADDPALAGMPDIPASLEGRLSASRRLGSGWSFTSALTQDLGHPRHGAKLNAGIGWAGSLAPNWRARAGVGLEAANGSFMRTHFGVAPAAALAGTRPAYEPGAGVLSTSLGGSLQYKVSQHWLLTTSATYGRLTGPAASSPLTHRAGAVSTMVGLAYVSGGH